MSLQIPLNVRASDQRTVADLIACSSNLGIVRMLRRQAHLGQASLMAPPSVPERPTIYSGKVPLLSKRLNLMSSTRSRSMSSSARRFKRSQLCSDDRELWSPVP